MDKKVSKKYIALDFGKDARLLDHLAPLCDIFQMPLLVSDEKNFSILKKYYPHVQSIFLEPDQINYEQLAVEYDVFFQSLFWQDNVIEFFGSLHGKKNRYIYCPHGNSDKGHVKPLLSPIISQDIVFYYGEQMKERLIAQKLWDKISNKMVIGNYRLYYYQKNKTFLDDLVEKEIFSKLDATKKTILYAPTWEDGENVSSFFQVAKKMAEELPENINLIIKPHPLLEEHDIVKYHIAMGHFQNKKNVLILEDYPLIYPILSKVDIYLGDFSSIGYDFLVFQKPMFFFLRDFYLKTANELPSVAILSCGVPIDEKVFAEHNIFDFLEKKISLANGLVNEQHETALLAFGERTSPGQLRGSLALLLRC